MSAIQWLFLAIYCIISGIDFSGGRPPEPISCGDIQYPPKPRMILTYTISCDAHPPPSRSATVLNALVCCCRDPTELQKPTSVNTPVVRFYRYIQAARDGQEAKDCLRLYPACTLATEWQQRRALPKSSRTFTIHRRETSTLHFTKVATRATAAGVDALLPLLVTLP